VPPNEWDVAELANGDLLAMMRTYRTDRAGNPIRAEQVRRQARLRKEGDAWVMEKPAATPFEHSGHPELLATREGVVLYIATNGTPGSVHGLYYTADGGTRWRRLRMPGGRRYRSGYYPISLQDRYGRVFVFSHQGGDDAYRPGLRQSVIIDTFCLQTNGKATRCDPKMRVAVTPRRAKAGADARFRVRVTTRVGRRTVPVRGATVRFAGGRARTNRAGRVTFGARLRAGRYGVRATRARLRPGSTTVRVAP
jgi:hypothetical protein